MSCEHKCVTVFKNFQFIQYIIMPHIKCLKYGQFVIEFILSFESWNVKSYDAGQYQHQLYKIIPGLSHIQVKEIKTLI